LHNTVRCALKVRPCMILYPYFPASDGPKYACFFLFY
jgi:hypothetical protein